MWIVIMLAIIIFGILIVIQQKKANKNSKEKNKLINDKNKEYHKRYNISHNYNVINCNNINGEVINESLYMWENNNNLNFISSNYLEEEKRILRELLSIPIDNIIFYAMEGDYRIDNIVEGGGISLSGAIIGGVIAGNVGAVLGGRKKITTTQKTVDERQTYLYYKENGEMRYIVFNQYVYETLRKLYPYKDIKFLEKKKIAESSNTEPLNKMEENTIYKDIEELTKLKDKGILTENEFNEKKKILLEKIQ